MPIDCRTLKLAFIENGRRKDLSAVEKSDALAASTQRKLLSNQTLAFYEFTKEDRAEEKKERDAKILDVYLACHTEQEIVKGYLKKT